jgi:inosine/xanthosine triphosphatase
MHKSPWAPTPPRVVAVGSLNPTKLGAAVVVFAHLWPDARVEGVSAASGVREQPIGWQETEAGAVTRAETAAAALDTPYGVGLEGGVVFEGERAWLMGVAAVASPRGPLLARGATVLLPPVVARRVADGEELGPVVDSLTGLTDAKTGMGAVGWLTRGLLVREQTWVDTLARAAVPLLRPEWYFPNG